MAAWYEADPVIDETQTTEKPWYENDPVNIEMQTAKPDLQQFTEALKANIEKSGKQPMSVLEALDAGFGLSVTGLVSRNALPEKQVTPDDPVVNRIASQIGQTVGDIPAMVLGAWYGSELGGETLQGAGQVMGAGAGAFAVPEIIRKTYIQNLEKGQIKSFDDYWARVSATAIAGGKAAIVGGGAAGTGIVAGAATKFAGPVISDLAGNASEIAAMAVLGRTIEGELPTMQDFTDAAILIAGIKGSTYASKKSVAFVSKKLRDIYVYTGQKPSSVVKMAGEDSFMRQEIVATNNEIPTNIGKIIDQSIKREDRAEITNDAVLTAPKDFGGEKTISKADVDKLPEFVSDEVIKTPEQSSQSILDRIAEPVKNKFSFADKKDQFIYSYIDKYDPILNVTKIMHGEKLPTLENPYELARLTAGNMGRADQFLKYGTYEFSTLNNNGKSLLDLLAPVKAELDDFKAFAIARRTKELTDRGVKTGVDEKAASDVLQSFANNEKFQKAFDELVQYQNNVTKYLKDSGIVDEKTYNQMLEANKSYIPMYRFFDEKQKPQSVRGLNVRNPIKKIKGSELKIVDPIESIIKNTYLYIDIAEKNRVLNSLVSLAEKTERQDVIQKVPSTAKATNVDVKEIEKYLSDHGITLENMPWDNLTIFRKGWQMVSANEFAVFRNGKREVYQADPDLVSAIKGMDRTTTDLITKILSQPAKMLRAGVTLSPEFMARNAIRDQMVAFIQGKGYVPIYHMVSGFGSLMKKDAEYQNWLKSGGANSAMVEIDRQYIQQNLLKLNNETSFIKAAYNVVTSPLEILRVVSEVIENSTRIGQFKAMAKTGESMSDILARGLESREVTVDFAKEGAKVRSISMMTAFLNARIQGMDRLYRQLKDKPLETVVKGMAAYTIPSMYLWWSAYTDETETKLADGTVTTRGKIYRDLPAWQKNMFHIVMVGKDEDLKIFRIPKAFEYGLFFGSLPERILESWFEKNPNSLKEFGNSLIDSLVIDFTPTVANPMVEQFANRSRFTNRPLVSYADEKLLPEFQYNEYTTETAKLLAKGFRSLPWMDEVPNGLSIQSPIVVDNYIRQWTGTLGTQLISAVETSLQKAGVTEFKNLPEKAIESTPFVRAFMIRYPSAITDSTEKFYQKYREHQTVTETFKRRVKEGDLKVDEFLSNYGIKFGAPDGIKSALDKNGQLISMIVADKTMTPAEKRQYIDMLYSIRITFSKRGLDVLKEMEDAMSRSGLK